MLRGQSATPPEVIRTGEERCIIKGTFGDRKPDLIVTRTFTRQGSGDVTMSLKITHADGSPVGGKQQKFLDDLLPKGDVSFDPLSFARLSDSKPGRREQYEILQRLIPGVNFDDIAKKRKKAYDDRTIANRQRDDAALLAERVELPPGTCPQAIDVAAKIREASQAGAANAQAQEAYRALVARHDVIEEARAKIAELRAEADQLEMLTNDQAEELGPLPEPPVPVDTAAIEAEIARAQDVDRVRALFAKRDEHEANVLKYGDEAEKLDAEIKALDKKRVDAIASARLPVPGLGLGDDEILLNGHPFSQAGTSEKLKVAVSIQMALNPELKVMTLDEASELDTESMKWLEDISEKNGYTIICVKVDESGHGICIEDGEVRDEKA